MADRQEQMTPGGKGKADYEGFGDRSTERSGELNAKLNLRKIPEMEETINVLMERLEKTEVVQGNLRRELDEIKSQMMAIKMVNEELKEENDYLKKQLKKDVMEVSKQREEIQQTIMSVEEKQVV